jgi:hypothetical protein
MPIRMTEKKFKRFKAKKISEKELQIAFIKWFKLNHPKCLIISHPLEATYNRRDLILMGACPGTPDIQIIEPNVLYRGLWLELKMGRNKASELQIEFMHKLELRGYKTAVCYSLDEAINIVNDYLTPWVMVDII